MAAPTEKTLHDYKPASHLCQEKFRCFLIIASLSDWNVLRNYVIFIA